MNLTLKDIEYFVAMVEHGSLARAAIALGVSQPALSKSLKRTEEDTGLALFHRNSRPIQLTSAGTTFLEHARRLNAEYAGAVRNITELRTGNAGLLRIGATGATMDTVVLPTLARMFPLRPAMRVQLHVDLSDSLADMVELGSLDLAVVPTYTAQTAQRDRVAVVGIDELSVVTNQEALLDRQSTIPLALLREQHWILPKSSSRAREMFDAGFTQAGVAPPEASLEVDFVSDGVLELASASGFLVAIPGASLARAARLGLYPLPLDPRLKLQRSRSLIGRDISTWSPLMREFAERLRS